MACAPPPTSDIRGIRPASPWKIEQEILIMSEKVYHKNPKSSMLTSHNAALSHFWGV